uniref:Uncharacterized protein n=1 Tax=Vitis vinifera TaxID=29760 RepID=F6HRU8_VITVI
MDNLGFLHKKKLRIRRSKVTRSSRKKQKGDKELKSWRDGQVGPAADNNNNNNHHLTWILLRKETKRRQRIGVPSLTWNLGVNSSGIIKKGG